MPGEALCLLTSRFQVETPIFFALSWTVAQCFGCGAEHHSCISSTQVFQSGSGMNATLQLQSAYQPQSGVEPLIQGSIEIASFPSEGTFPLF
jgi:hypothetical protein